MAETLTERRARFVYDSARLAADAAGAPIVPAPWEDREEPFRIQFCAVIERQCGEQRSRSPEELHGSWMQAYFAMGWVYGETYDRENKKHPDLVPYADLGQLERDKDSVFVALCEIARQWIYGDARPSTTATRRVGAVARVSASPFDTQAARERQEFRQHEGRGLEVVHYSLLGAESDLTAALDALDRERGLKEHAAAMALAETEARQRANDRENRERALRQKLARQLELVMAGVWDAHYGKGIAVAYARALAGEAEPLLVQSRALDANEEPRRG